MLYLINICIRGITLVSKFLLMFILVRYLNVEDVGLYGLIVATVTYSIYPLGLEFYTYSTREIIRSSIPERYILIKSQFFLYIYTYPVVFCFVFAIFIKGFLPWSIVCTFFVILMLEHLNQECYRLLIATSEQTSATVTLFVRQGLWVWICLGIFYFYPELRDLNSVLRLWLLGSLCSFVFSCIKIGVIKVVGTKVNRAWIIKGVRLSIPFLLSSIFIMAISIADRYWYEVLVSREVLGYYVFYSGLVSALVSFLDAAVFSFIYPKLVHYSSIDDWKNFNRQMKTMSIRVILIAIVFVSVSVQIIDYVVLFLGKHIGLMYKNIYYILLISTSFLVLSYIPHYGLYARCVDKPIVISHVASLFIFIVITYFISFYTKVLAIPISLGVTYGTLFLFKLSVYIFFSRKMVVSTHVQGL